MKGTRIAAIVLISSVIVGVAAQNAFNMPMFARKYELGCNSCHTVVPKLTRMGMDFRAAGFRMPDEIGQEDKDVNNISTQNSTRLQARYDLSRTKDPSNAVVASRKVDRSQLTFHEITLYPLTGAFNKNFSSLFEISLAPEEPADIENAYVRGDWKTGNGYVSGRAGIFHPFEGFGASDRPVSLARPLFQTSNAKDTLGIAFPFTPWNLDEAGLELGYNIQNTSIRATLFNGIVGEFSGKKLVAAHPAQALTGGFAKDPSRSDFNNKDFQVFLNQILKDNGGGVSVYYYNGAVDIPVADKPDSFYKDKFDRIAGYASYPVVNQLVLLAGGQWGRDKAFSRAAGLHHSNSRGVFGEADVDLTQGYWLAGRYDLFDPSDLIGDNQTDAVTVAVNKPFDNGLQFISEYRYTRTKQGKSEDKTGNAFQTRLIWIW